MLRKKWLVAALATSATFGVASAFAKDGKRDGRRPIPESVFDRIAMARVYQTGRWTLPNQTPDSVGKTLADLKPTWVAGLVRVKSSEDLTATEAAAFKTIRNHVRAKSPRCKFDVVLNGKDYRTPREITKKMEQIHKLIPVDMWFFDFYNRGYRSNPRVTLAAIEWAHRHGQWIGGNCWGTRVPPGSDFASLDDVNFILNRSHIKAIRRRTGLPVTAHLNNNPQHGPTGDCARFIQKWDAAKREAYVEKFAGRQAEWGFRFMYPVFFPEYPVGKSYDATSDGKMLKTIEDLLDRHDRK